jgi:hypothetical protein
MSTTPLSNELYAEYPYLIVNTTAPDQPQSTCLFSSRCTQLPGEFQVEQQGTGLDGQIINLAPRPLVNCSNCSTSSSDNLFVGTIIDD